jgi:hypothetical protein
VGPPGTPSNFKVALDGAGVILTWKCANPAGRWERCTSVFRKCEGEADFTYIGGSGAKNFTDTTIPAGQNNVTYKLQAQRTTGAGLWATFNVFFGASGGEVTETQVEGRRRRRHEVRKEENAE